MHLHQSDDRLPGIALLLQPNALANHVRNWLGPGELAIENIRYKPGNSCLVSYRLVDGDRVCHVHAKAFDRTDWPVRRRKIAPPALVENELALAVFRFPLDARLDALLDFAACPESFFSGLLFEDMGDELFTGYETLAYKPNRRMVARINFASGKAVVLKLHDAKSFKAVLQSASALRKLAVRGLPIRIGRSKRHRALAYQWIPGKPLDIATMDAGQRRAMLDEMFACLKDLHQPVNTRKSKLAVRRPAQGVAEVAADLGALFSPFAAWSREMAETIINNEPREYFFRLIHGDFHAHQIVQQPGRVVACDFDNACISDETCDLANFNAHLHYQSCRKQLSKEVVAEIDDDCRRRLGKDGVNQRYSWNLAACLMRLVTHPFRAGSEDWIEQTEALLQLVQQQIQVSSKTAVTGRGNFKRSDDGVTKRLRDKIQTDPAFNFLKRVFEPAKSTAVLRKHLPILGQCLGDFRVGRAIARRYKPGRRCLVEFELVMDDDVRTILGKSSAKRLKKKAIKIQRRLFEKHGFGNRNNDGIGVPRTIGCCEPWQMWFQEKIEAESAGQLMSKDRLHEVADRIAAAVAKLHQCGFVPKRRHSIHDELEELSNRLTRSAREISNEKARIQRILRNCVQIGGDLSEAPAVPVHRDFYQDQIIFSGDRTWLVDLDLIALGHPALDIGNFTAHLAEHGIRVHGQADYWRVEEMRIIEKYLELNPQCELMDILAYKAISFARHVSISHEKADRRLSTARIIDHAEQLTGEVVSPGRTCLK